MSQLEREVATIPFRSCWSNSRSTGQLLRIVRQTASLWRAGVQGYPLHQFWKAKDGRTQQWAGSRSRDGAGYNSSLSCLHFFASRIFSVMAFDKLLLMASWPSMSILLELGMHNSIGELFVRAHHFARKAVRLGASFRWWRSLSPVSAQSVP